MSKYALILYFFLAGFLGMHIPGHASEGDVNQVIDVMAGEWPPYVYKEDGKIKGYSYQIIKDVLDKANISFRFNIAPWARTYQTGLQGKNVLICGLGRTEERETLFNWIGPVTKGIDHYFYRLQHRKLDLKDLNDVKGLRVAVERYSYHHDFLLTHGFEENDIIALTKSEQSLLMLVKERVDLVLLEDNQLLEQAKKLDLKPDQFTKATFAFREDDYMAFSSNTSPHIINSVKSAYQQLKNANKINLY